MGTSGLHSYTYFCRLRKHELQIVNVSNSDWRKETRRCSNSWLHAFQAVASLCFNNGRPKGLRATEHSSFCSFKLLYPVTAFDSKCPRSSIPLWTIEYAHMYHDKAFMCEKYTWNKTTCAMAKHACAKVQSQRKHINHGQACMCEKHSLPMLQDSEPSEMQDYIFP